MYLQIISKSINKNYKYLYKEIFKKYNKKGAGKLAPFAFYLYFIPAIPMRPFICCSIEVMI